jgi:alpha-1,3-glucan synthase
LYEVKGDKTDYNLQKVEPTFNDTNGKYYKSFEEMLQTLDGKTSEGDLCVEEYLIESEKEWFKRMRDAKLGKARDLSSHSQNRLSKNRAPSPYKSMHERPQSAYSINTLSREDLPGTVTPFDDEGEDEFLLGKNFKRASFLKRWVLTRIADWPIYSLLLALGQIIAANSYQITLLTGGQGLTNEKLYIIGTIYIITSCMWWLMFRTLKSVYVLSVPFLFYGLAFFLVGGSVFLGAGSGRGWMRNVASGMYVAASSSGSLFFALNFGDEAKSFLPPPPFLPNPILTLHSRWCSNQILGLSCLYHPRHAANLRHCTILLE